MIKVLVVDDSPVMRQLIRAILESDPELSVVGEAGNGEEAIRMCSRKNPDIITMDLVMPKMDGNRAAQRIMAENPRPIIILTGSESIRKMKSDFKDVKDNVVMVAEKPRGLSGKDSGAEKLISQIKAMAGVRVVRRRPLTTGHPAHEPGMHSGHRPGNRQIKLIVIGASTGGPPAICSVLNSLPVPLPVPVAVVQHISVGFIQGMMRWLNDTTPYSVKVVDNGEILRPGNVYMAPDKRHFEIRAGAQARLVNSDLTDGHCPSVTQLFVSVAKSFGSSAVGILLTGMGRDGAHGLRALREAGGRTIAQDEESSVVFGMPKEAIALGAAMDILSLDQIGQRVSDILSE